MYFIQRDCNNFVEYGSGTPRTHCAFDRNQFQLHLARGLHLPCLYDIIRE